MFIELEKELKTRGGEFVCEAIGDESEHKVVQFSHLVEVPAASVSVPDVGDLMAFYATFASLTLFFCSESNESAFYIAKPEQWPALADEFADWVDDLDEDEHSELLPPWFGCHLVIGDIPASGNYLLVVTEGEHSGAIYEFEHDGFAFIKRGNTLFDFIQRAIDPDEAAFSAMASHMRFTSINEHRQWWARELRHNSGKVVRSLSA